MSEHLILGEIAEQFQRIFQCSSNSFAECAPNELAPSDIPSSPSKQTRNGRMMCDLSRSRGNASVCLYTEDVELLVRFSAIESQSVEMEDLTVNIQCGAAGLRPAQLERAFYVVHNLPYYRHQLGRFAPDYCFHELTIREDPGQWRITLIDRGGPLDFDYKDSSEVPLQGDANEI